MGFLRRIAGILGFAKDEGHDTREEEDDDDESFQHGPPCTEEQVRGPRKGFSVPVQVPVDRAPLGPILVPCSSGEGGVQGLRWYAKCLKVDEDGDVAHEFLSELKSLGTANAEDHQRAFPKFELKCSSRAAKVRNQVLSVNGKVQHCIENQGRLEWV